jgi:hypothetical protein
MKHTWLRAELASMIEWKLCTIDQHHRMLLKCVHTLSIAFVHMHAGHCTLGHLVCAVLTYHVEVVLHCSLVASTG